MFYYKLSNQNVEVENAACNIKLELKSKLNYFHHSSIAVHLVNETFYLYTKSNL